MNRATASFTTTTPQHRASRPSTAETGASPNMERYPMTNSPAETSQTREGAISYGRRRHHVLDAFQTSGSSPPTGTGAKWAGRHQHDRVWSR